jgi:hypothetical protein
MSTGPLAITMSLTNMFEYISFSAPLLVVFFITLLSIAQNSLEKGIIFNMGIVILSSIVLVLKNVIKSKQTVLASPFCNILPSPFTVKDMGVIYNAPSLSSAILSFSSTYLIYPMIINKNSINYSLLVFLLSVTAINGVTELNQKCSDIMGLVLGLLVGIIFGIIYYTLLYMAAKGKYVYFADTVSNNVQCGKPTNQQFKCQVYQNGEVIM